MTVEEFLNCTPKDDVYPTLAGVQALMDSGGTQEQAVVVLATLKTAVDHGLPTDVNDYFETVEGLEL